MSQITLKISGLEKVQVGLRSIGAAIPDATREDVRQAMENAHNEYLGGEPGGYSVPQIPNQAYQRTGNLGAWMYVQQSGLASTLYSKAPYAALVHGDAEGGGQAYVHAGRWPLFQQVVRKWADTLLVTIEATLSRIIRSQGMGGEAGGM